MALVLGEEIEKLVTTIEDLAIKAANEQPVYDDAITRVLGGAPRTTGVVSIREHNTIVAFREALAKGKRDNDLYASVIAVANGVLGTFLKMP